MTLDRPNYQALVEEATRKWAGVEPIDPTIYTITQGLPGSEPLLPTFQGPDGPDDEYWALVGGQGYFDEGEWKLSLFFDTEPDRCRGSGALRIGEVVECGEWAMRAVAAWDGGGSFVLLSHPDLPPFVDSTAVTPSS